MAKQTRKSSKEESGISSIVPEIPVRVTIEVIVRHEYPLQLKTNNLYLAGEAGGAGCPDNKFTYSFERENASVLSLIVEEFDKDNPDDSGEFTTCIYDPNPVPKVRIIGLAKEDNVGGRVALTIKFLGKDIFTKPKEFTRAANGFLKLHELVKLPVS